MLIKDSYGTELFVEKDGDGLYISLLDSQNHQLISLNKEQLHGLHQYICACVSDQPLDDVLQYGA